MIRYNKISHFCYLTLKMAVFLAKARTFCNYHYPLGFLNLSAIDNLGWIICFGGGLSCACRILSSIPGFYSYMPVAAKTVVINKGVSKTLPSVCLLERKSPHVRITAILSTNIITVGWRSGLLAKILVPSHLFFLFFCPVALDRIRFLLVYLLFSVSVY